MEARDDTIKKIQTAGKVTRIVGDPGLCSGRRHERRGLVQRLYPRKLVADQRERRGYGGDRQLAWNLG